MAILTRKERPIEEVSDRTLKQRVERARKALAELPDGQSLSSQERDAALAKARPVAMSGREAKVELERRAADRTARERVTAHATAAAQGHELRQQRVLTDAAVEGLQRIGRAVGLKLDARRLDANELDELLDVWSRFREGAGELDRARLEELCEKAADTHGFFDARRQKTQEVRRVAELREEAHVATLPRRVEYAEPGSIRLPRIVFAWLQTSRGGEWSVIDVGALAALLSSFEEGRSLVDDANFEDDASGERVLIHHGAREKLRFLRSVDPGLSAADTTGEVKLDAVLTRLATNGWLDVRHLSRYRTEIRLGERAKRSRAGTG